MSLAPRLFLSLTAAAMIAAAPAAAASIPQFGPNPGVAWILLGQGFQPPESGTGPVGEDPAHPLITNDDFRDRGAQPTMPVGDLNSPILLPWTREGVRKYNERALANKALSPSARCWPPGPAFLLRDVQPYYFIQTPERVLIVNQGDHQFRHIWLKSRHSPNVKPSWSGESIGHYEGDELVVDTIGISGRTPTDNFYTPHTDQLHMVERFRMTSNGDRLEVRLHFEDPGAFTMPWNARIYFRRVEPGRAENNTVPSLDFGATPAGPMIERSCAENLFPYFGEDTQPEPEAKTADF
jgi:hypothetical protein